MSDPETARAAAAHGVGGWRQHRHLGKRVKEGFNPVRSARRGKQTPEKVETYLGLCRDLVERAEGTVKALVGKGVEEAECRLIRYIAHARQPDRPGRPAFTAGRADSSPGEGVLHPSSRTRAGSRRASRAGRWNWGLRSAWSRTSTSSSPSQAVVEGRRRGGRGADDRGDPSAVPRSADV